MIEDFEQLLREMQPSHPSLRLKDSLRSDLARKQTPWLVPALAGLVLLVAVGTVVIWPRASEAAAFSYREVPAATETLVFLQQDGPPLKVTKTAFVAACEWKDSRGGSEGAATFPRELIVISELEIQ